MNKTPIPPAIRFLLATLCINAIGFGIIVPVMPALLMELTGSAIDHATAVSGWLSLAFAAFQFVFSPIVGNLSDRFGRRPVLLASVGGFALDFLLLALAPTLAWVFVARAVSGICGASNSAAQSAIADLTAPEERARYFGMLGAAFGIGFVLGPAIGGLLGEFGPRVPFYAAAFLAGANFLYGLYAMPETLDPQHRRPFSWRNANPVGAVLRVGRLPGMIPIASVYLLWQVASLVYPMTWPFFTIARYGWSNAMVGLSLAMVGLSLAAAQMILIPRLVPRYGERKSAMIGIAVAALAMLGFVVADRSWMVFALILPMSFQALVHPNLTAMMARRANATNQGEVQGFGSGIMALGSLIAPVVYNPLQAYFTGPQAPFLFYGVAYLVAGLVGLTSLPILFAMKRAATPDVAARNPD